MLAYVPCEMCCPSSPYFCADIPSPLLQLVTPDNAQGAPVVPFTVPVQTAIELVFRAVLPPLSNGLGPRWARVLAYSPGRTPAQGVNVTLLMYNSQTPLSEFLTVSLSIC